MQLSTPQKKFCSPVKSLGASPLETPEKLADRYMTPRASANLLSAFEKAGEWDTPPVAEPAESAYTALLKHQLFRQHQPSPGVAGRLPLTEEEENVPRMVTERVCESNVCVPAQRLVPHTPFKILDAPSLQDDFYLNVLDWSNKDVIAVGLMGSVFLWSASNLRVTKLCEFNGNCAVTSLSWAGDGQQLAVGTSAGSLHIFDVARTRETVRFLAHNGRLGTIAWNDQLLATASRDRVIGLRDMRIGDNLVSALKGHRQEVCGLKWSPDGRQLASGGNDNKVLLWELHSANPIAKFKEHCAAVKALAWAPLHRGVLLSGGGTADRQIRFWNTLSLESLHSVETGSQVCSLLFSKTTNEFVSTHGYSQNQVMLWNYAHRSRVAAMSGHASRVLYSAISPDGQTVVTGAGDETLRFWNLFPKIEAPQESECRLTPSAMDLR